ncbi:MAG: 4a-hydroxytetrahydrobiopterin dehydratase [Candidatus Manganitrophus sp.]|nr:4a-hydroxytetrahydrobiopterin dehydratase [Candidatus Manganitrophus morganii]MDC4206112.1 4a-hydroxytetrahydrobiopterin dehydratase [Candidatus Manganitrophus sp.]MCG3117374.1 4a-hydroxytetrahydrobiopterin dehydratase [Candidatus Manganitrophus morganii]MDC4226779.1 4a-hydroxytetrahydrobiopterin dehydratase [Candidatus Manganitrophus sp.]WDT73282.1 MAG: 4a-hydroxytetrahydrobiopterin dehydratase [Candidatus Manganitrophus sp.]
MGLLSMEEVRRKIHDLKGWELYDNMLQKKYSFRTFKTAMQFVNRVAELADSVDHHPDMMINYNRVLLKLMTHSQGGITDRDFNLAQMIDQVEKPPTI